MTRGTHPMHIWETYIETRTETYAQETRVCKTMMLTNHRPETKHWVRTRTGMINLQRESIARGHDRWWSNDLFTHGTCLLGFHHGTFPKCLFARFSLEGESFFFTFCSFSFFLFFFSFFAFFTFFCIFCFFDFFLIFFQDHRIADRKLHPVLAKVHVIYRIGQRFTFWGSKLICPQAIGCSHYERPNPIRFKFSFDDVSRLCILQVCL